MDYCEGGDLSGRIKNARRLGTAFSAPSGSAAVLGRQAVLEDLSAGSGRQVVYPGSMVFQTHDRIFIVLPA